MQCPVCRKERGEAAACPRCGFEYALLDTIEVSARRALIRAVHALRKGDIEAGGRHARRSWDFHNSTLAAVALAICTAGSDYEEATRWVKRALERRRETEG